MAKGFSSGLKTGFAIGSDIGEAVSRRRVKKQFSKLLSEAPEDLSPIEKISYAVQAGLEQGLFTPEQATPLIKSALETEQKRMEVERQKQLDQVMEETRNRIKAYAEAYRNGDFDAALEAAQPYISAYNSQLIPDGRMAEFVRGQNGQPLVAVRDMKTGEVIGQLPASPEFFAVQAHRLTAARLATIDPRLAVEFSQKPLFMSRKDEIEILRGEAAAAKDRAAAKRTETLTPYEAQSIQASTAKTRADTARTRTLTPLEAENLQAEAGRTRALTQETLGLLPYRQMGLAAEAGLTSARRREIDTLLPFKRNLMDAQTENFYSLSDLRRAQAQETRELLPVQKGLMRSQATLNQSRARGTPVNPIDMEAKLLEMWTKGGGSFTTPEDLMGYQKFRSMVYGMQGRAADDLSAVKRGLTMPREPQPSLRSTLPPYATVFNPSGGQVLPPMTVDEARRRLEEAENGPLSVIVGGSR